MSAVAPVAWLGQARPRLSAPRIRTREDVRIRADARDEVAAATDAEIIARSLEHPEVFARVFDRHHEAIHRFLWTRAGSGRADDLAAETFRIAFERRDTYDPDYPSAKPWLFGIASNLAKQEARRVAKRDEVRDRMDGRDLQPRHAAPEEGLADLATDSPAAQAVLDLPERDREPLLLYAWEDLTYEEIARALDVPVGTVRSRIHRARQEVRGALEDDADVPASRGGGDG